MGNKWVVACFLVLFFTMCESNNEVDDLPPDCSLISCVIQTMSVELIDEDGINLITNGTYLLEDISVFKGDNQLSMFSGGLDTTIIFGLGGAEGKNTYSVILNSAETDIVVVHLEEKFLESECCGPFYMITEVKYNGNTVEVLREEGMIDRIVVVK